MAGQERHRPFTRHEQEGSLDARIRGFTEQTTIEIDTRSESCIQTACFSGDAAAE